jgi:hypothetical protein
MAATITPPVGRKVDKVIRNSLLGAIRQGPEKLKKAAEAVLDNAANGDLACMQFLAERIDGRVPQPVSSDPDNPFIMYHAIQRQIVDGITIEQQPEPVTAHIENKDS